MTAPCTRGTCTELAAPGSKQCAFDRDYMKLMNGKRRLEAGSHELKRLMEKIVEHNKHQQDKPGYNSAQGRESHNNSNKAKQDRRFADKTDIDAPDRPALPSPCKPKHMLVGDQRRRQGNQRSTAARDEEGEESASSASDQETESNEQESDEDDQSGALSDDQEADDGGDTGARGELSFEEHMNEQRTFPELQTLMYDYLKGRMSVCSSSTTISKLMRKLHAFVEWFVNEKETRAVTMQQLMTAKVQQQFLKGQSENAVVETTALFVKLHDLSQTFKSITPPDTLKHMAKGARQTHNKHMASKKTNEGGFDVPTSRQDGKPINVNRIRNMTLQGMLEFITEELPRMQGLMKGTKRFKSFNKGELKTLASLLNALIQLAFKPTRAAVLNTVTMTQMRKFIADDVLLLKQAKASVTERNVVITTPGALWKRTMETILKWVIPTLLHGGMSISNPTVEAAKGVSSKWTAEVWRLINLDDPEWLMFLTEKGIELSKNKKRKRFDTIMLVHGKAISFSATYIKTAKGKSKSKTLKAPTPLQVYRATMMRHNEFAFLNASGGKDKQLGVSLAHATMTFAGESIKTTIFRKLVTTESKELDKDEKKMVDQALEHTTAVAESNYTLSNITELKKGSLAWNKHFEGGLEWDKLAKYM
jgi:hypothetical protein